MATPTVVLGFDMETDIGSWTTFYEGLQHGTPRILEVLKKNNVASTFFFTGDSVKAHPEVALSVKDAGYEIGAHTLFHETIGDALFEIPGMLPVLPEEVPNRLKRNTELIESITGVRPISFRCPRLFGSTAVVNALNDLGYVADATYPMYFFREQLAPYHPSREDWTQSGDLNIVELPNFADLSMATADAYGRDMDQWPLFRTQSADALLAHVERFMEYAEAHGVEPFLCFYFHPWEFHPMPQGEIRSSEGGVRPDPFITLNCGEYAVEQLDLLIQGLKARGAEFLEAREVAARCPVH